MAQALGYGAAAAVTTAADTALQSAVNGLPALPSVAAPLEPSGMPAKSSTAIRGDSATLAQPGKADQTLRHPDPPTSRHPVLKSSAGLTAPRGAAAPPALNAAKAATTFKAGADQASPASQVAIDPRAAAMPVDTDATPSMLIVVDSKPLRPGSAGQTAQSWTMSGRFPDDPTSSLPMGLAIMLAMVVSAASAWGFVRLMSERCPQCSALLERHSAGCRNCGAHLPGPGLRLSS